MATSRASANPPPEGGEDALTGLLVEDSPTDALMLQAVVGRGTPLVKLIHAETLKDGLDVLHRGGSIDFVLMDLSLPDARGIETVARAHAARPEVAIIVLTGLDDEGTAIRAMHEGAQDYLVKGQVDRSVLIRAIRYARERKKTEEASHRLVREQAARASAEAAERRAHFLADASRALASSLDFDRTLFTVAGLAVPVVADGCLIDLLQENGRIKRVAAISMEGNLPELWREEPRDPPPPTEPLGHALRTGEVIGLTDLSVASYRTLRLPPKWQDMLPHSAKIVPMLARGRTLGALTFITWLPEKRQGQESLLAMELAGRAALAVDNARLYSAREQILEVVSHDLRTPLTTLLANVSLIQDMQVPPKGPLEVIGRAAQHMNQLVEDLLDMSRLERGTFVLEREPLNMATVLDEVFQMMHSSAEVRGLKLQVSAPSELPMVNADKRRVLQVLWNLVGNGFKFTPAGGQVDLRAEVSDRELRLEVADNGPGVPEAQLPHMFQRFWQGESGDLRGIGLGLSIAKAIVEAHGGRIGVSSSPSGTTFFFTLPRIVAASTPASVTV